MAKDYMTDEERGQFRDWDNMFNSNGWFLLKKELAAELDHIPTRVFTDAKSFDEVVAYRVRARVLAEMLAYETIIQQRQDQLVQERQYEEQDRKEAEVNKLL